MSGKKSKKELKSSHGFAGDDDGFGIEWTEEDIASVHVHHSGSDTFLDRYSENDMRRLMEEVGILEKLRKRGYPDILISFDLSDPFVQKMTWHTQDGRLPHEGQSWGGSGSNDEDEADDTLLCDCVLRVLLSVSLLKAGQAASTYSPGAAAGARMISKWADSVKGHDPAWPLKLCVVEWLLLQDPRAHQGAQPLLPGQKHPGLGVQRSFGELLERMSAECGFDAIVNRPLYFHNAVMYAAPDTTFFNPHTEDCFRALCRDLVYQGATKGACLSPTHGKGPRPEVDGLCSSVSEGRKASGHQKAEQELVRQHEGMQVVSLVQLSHAVNCGALKWGTRASPGTTEADGDGAVVGKAVRWSAQEQISAMSQRARHFLRGQEYTDACSELSGISMEEHLLNVRALLHPETSCRAGAEGSAGTARGVLPTCRRQEDSEWGRKIMPEKHLGRFSVDWEVQIENLTAIAEILQAASPWHAADATT